MRGSAGSSQGGDAPRLDPLALAVWGAAAAIVVVALFPLFHAWLPHTLSIIVSGLAGIALAAVGYGWRSGDRSGRGLASAAALGGGLGMLALHLLPLLH